MVDDEVLSYKLSALNFHRVCFVVWMDLSFARFVFTPSLQAVVRRTEDWEQKAILGLLGLTC